MESCLGKYTISGYFTEEIVVSDREANLSELLVYTGFCKSKSEFYRWVKEGSLSMNGRVLLCDHVLDLTIPDLFTEVRRGMRYLEIVKTGGKLC